MKTFGNVLERIKQADQRLYIFELFDQIVSQLCLVSSSSIYKKKMISAFYKISPSRKEKISRQTNRTPPFMIPSQHLLDNAADILRLKKQCLKYQQEFTFIRDQIDRQARLKKQASRQIFEIDRGQLENALMMRPHAQDRQQRRKELGISSRELIRRTVRKDNRGESREGVVLAPHGVVLRRIN